MLAFPVVNMKILARRFDFQVKIERSLSSRRSTLGNSSPINVCACFILKVQGFVKIPGYEPVELDLEKLFLLSVSKGNLYFRGKHEKNLPYKICLLYTSPSPRD